MPLSRNLITFNILLILYIETVKGSHVTSFSYIEMSFILPQLEPLKTTEHKKIQMRKIARKR